MDLQLILAGGQQLLDTTNSYNVVETETHHVLERLLYDVANITFLSLLQNAALSILKSISRFDHRVDISLYLTEITTLCYSMETNRPFCHHLNKQTF